jgi:hypothetical protein
LSNFKLDAADGNLVILGTYDRIENDGLISVSFQIRRIFVDVESEWSGGDGGRWAVTFLPFTRRLRNGFGKEPCSSSSTYG